MYLGKRGVHELETFAITELGGPGDRLCPVDRCIEVLARQAKKALNQIRSMLTRSHYALERYFTGRSHWCSSRWRSPWP